MTKEQEEIINRLSKITNRQILYENKCGITIECFRELQEDIEEVLNMLKEKDRQIDLIKKYAHQEIEHYTETIEDYMDDDKEGNKNYIKELKEKREHWKDIERILKNKPEELYMNWWKYGLYE